MNNCWNGLLKDEYEASVWVDDNFKDEGVQSALQEEQANSALKVEQVEEDVEEDGMEGDGVTEVDGINYDVSGSITQEPDVSDE
ncbi:hypothetical protein NDU88_007196 [Pleurodeles waltl]|uniref:Uncharacterized protein n=1 Tax=Pleurodeles waltl TaxID=8319 RepID=A0AAV7UN57_PLEWA|nr:hypothetical protein NDU88_007196 [Pleurodeles waltl]